MKAVTIIFPHQLFEKHPALLTGRPVVLVEEYLFFGQYKFHKQKLAFHRATMKFYESYLKDQNYTVKYIDAHEANADVTALIPFLKEQGVEEIHYCDPTDNWLEKRLRKQEERCNIRGCIYDSPMFLLNKNELTYFDGKKKYFQTDFYIRQRKKFKILVDKQLDPTGGKWSFDGDNRLKYPKNKRPPEITFPSANLFWKNSLAYISKNFSENYGQLNETFIYPITYKEGRAWLHQFLASRFAEFGPYEDALVKDEHVLHHSVLTPLLNVGILTPKEVIDETLIYAEENNIPINSLEGFVRQIIGWREFMRGIYERAGSIIRTKNYWKFNRKIPDTFWRGETGIPPIDITIRKVLTTGYAHHIERLMVLGNFMLLCEFDPDEVYRWFMELFIDAYDWVMVSNVYGMSQFSDGGLITTKPYISGSNYLMKMSNYEKGDWQKTWDGLFWRFLHEHSAFFQGNPRLSMLILTLNKMNAATRDGHLKRADDFLKSLG
jgi:deoxyribodipyrimidine photolyase-related protein